MAVNYTSEHTGAEIDAAVTKANNPDSKVTEDSANLVTSGAVHDALFNPTATEAAALLKALGVNVSAEVLNYLSGLSGSLTDLLDKKVDNTDIIDVPHGGTGQKSLTADSFLAGNGTGAVKLLTPTEVLTKIGALPLSGGTMTGPLGITSLVLSHNSGKVIEKWGDDYPYSMSFGGASYQNSDGTVEYLGNIINILAKEKVVIDPALGLKYGGTGATTAQDAATNLCEVGTWTPAHQWATNMETPTITYNTQIGGYIRIGKMVHAWWKLKFTTESGWTANGDYFRIDGLPYTSLNNNNGGYLYTTIIPSKTAGACFAQTRSGYNHMAIMDAAGSNIKLTNSNIGTFYFYGAITYQIEESYQNQE